MKNSSLTTKLSLLSALFLLLSYRLAIFLCNCLQFIELINYFNIRIERLALFFFVAIALDKYMYMIIKSHYVGIVLYIIFFYLFLFLLFLLFCLAGLLIYVVLLLLTLISCYLPLNSTSTSSYKTAHM